MQNQFHINATMMDALHSIFPERLYRKKLIKAVQSSTKYNTAEKAEKFITRQIFRLTRNNFLTAHGGKNSRWYQPSNELITLVYSGTKCSKSSQQRLASEENKTTSELKLQLAEIEEFQKISERYPELIAYIEPLVSEGEERATCIHGKLNAIKKLRDSIKKVGYR